MRCIFGVALVYVLLQFPLPPTLSCYLSQGSCNAGDNGADGRTKKAKEEHYVLIIQ